MNTVCPPRRQASGIALLLTILSVLFSSTAFAAGQEWNEQAAYAPEALVILYPPDEATIFDNDGAIDVQIAVSPTTNLAPDNKIELFFNGRRVKRQKDGDFVLANVPSGWHRLRARIVSADGDIIANAMPVEFYKWQSMQGSAR